MATKTTTADTSTAPKAAPRTRRAAAKPAAAHTTRRTKAKATTATTAAPEQVLADLAAEVAAAQVALAAAMAKRDTTVAGMLADKAISGPKAAAAMGVTPMAVYNMAKRAK